MISYLQLRNFKKHTDLRVDFTPGLNGVFGGNYAGKSTLLYGIMYAIGGASFVPGTQLISRGASAGMKVEMEFHLGPEIYRVTRTKTTANLNRMTNSDLEVIATGTTAVNEAMEKILGLPLKRFSQLHYAEQKKAHIMLHMGAAELNSTLEELTGVATLSEALKHLAKMKAALSAVLEEMPLSDEEMPDLAAFEKDVGEATELVEALQLQAEDVERKSLELYTLWSNLNKDRIAHTKYTEVMSDLHAKQAVLESAIEDLKGRLQEEADKCKGSAQLAQELTHLLADQDIAKRSAEEAKEAYDSRQHSLKSVEDMTSKIEELKAQLPEYVRHEEALREAEQAEAATAHALKAAEVLHEQVANSVMDSSCHTCGRAFEGVDKDKLEKEQLELSTKVEQASTEFKQASKILGQAKQVHAEATRIETTITTLETNRYIKLEALKDFPEIAKKEVDDLAAALKELDTAVSEKISEKLQVDRAIEERDRLQEKLDKKSSTLDTLLQKAADTLPVTYSEEEFTAAVEARDEVYDLATEVKDKLSVAEVQLNTAALNLSTAEASIKRLQEERDKRASVESRLSRIVELAKFLRTNRDRYSAETWEYFMATASQFARSCTGEAIEGLSRTEAGKFVFTEAGYEMDLKEASGAQASILGLGIQAALAAASQSKLDILLVDEPTADMDAEHSMSTMALLASDKEQVIAISHQSMDSSLCNNVINL